MVGIKLLTAICLFIWVPEVEAEINQSQSDVCLEPKKVGPCKGLIKRFYFDQEANRCKRFNYGGCKGNANNFETKRKCMTTCPPRQADVCLEPKTVGPCKGLIKRFYFDQEANRCKRFNYGGCKGNANNFETKRKCMTTCPPRQADVCLEPKNPGPCEAVIRRFYYDQEKGRCKRFDYGGCEGNGNNFETKRKCMKACPPKQVASCLQPKKVGPCKAAFPRFFYNQETGECESFIWGGCQPNGNNFKNMLQCENECRDQVSPCEQPKKVGPCYAIKPKFYYNKSSGQCESFDWGGCQPNGNNFETIGMCEAMCLGQGRGCRPLKRKPDC